MRAPNTPQSVALRARIALRAANGLSNVAIARDVGCSRPTVILWRRRFAEGRPTALIEIATGRGRLVTCAADRMKALVEATTQTRPPDATHRSTRTMGRAQGASPSTGRRIWVAHGLQPHETKRFKLSGRVHLPGA